MMGVWVRERFCLRVRPSGIMGPLKALENRDAKD